MRKKLLTYALLISLAILVCPVVSTAEWYMRPSVGGGFISDEVELGDEPSDGTPKQATVKLDAKDLKDLKVGYWFTQTAFTRKFTRTHVGIEMELQKYTLSESKSFTHPSYSTGECTQYTLMYDWWTDSYWNVCVAWGSTASYDVNYQVDGDVTHIGLNFLLRRTYGDTILYPNGQRHIYIGAGIAYVMSNIDVISNGEKFEVADGADLTGAFILGCDFMFTPHVGVFFELNMSSVTHDFPVPTATAADENKSPSDVGSVYLTGIAYHF